MNVPYSVLEKLLTVFSSYLVLINDYIFYFLIFFFLSVKTSDGKLVELNDS